MLFVWVVLQARASSEPFIGYLDVDVRDVKIGKASIRAAT